MWLRIQSLIIKELLTLWRDPKGRFILLGPPLIEMFIFAYAATQEVKNVSIAVLNQDSGIYGRDLIARFEGSRNFREVRHLDAERDIARVIDSRSVLLVVHLREDFSRELVAGRPTTVQLILNGCSTNAAQILAGYAEVIINSYNAELAQTRLTSPPASLIIARVWFNPNLDALWSTVPSLVAILVALEGLMITGRSVARERELGTFEQLLVSPLSPREIVIGKTVPAFIVGIGEGTLMVTVAVVCFRIPLMGSIVVTISKYERVPAGHYRRGIVHLVARANAAAGDFGDVRGDGADDAAVGLRKPGGEHAGLAAGSDAGQSGAAFHRGCEGRVFESDANGRFAPKFVAARVDQHGHPFRFNPAVSSTCGVSTGAVAMARGGQRRTARRKQADGSPFERA